MNTLAPEPAPADEYDQCVAREREAWHHMQGLPSGSPDRAQAFLAWSHAISRTNQAWRRVPVQRPPAAAPQGHHA